MSGTARMMAVLSLRDNMRSGLRRAGQGVRSFSRTVDRAGGTMGRFSGRIGQMSSRLSKAFGSRMTRMVKGFFRGMTYGAAGATVALGAFFAGGISKAKDLERTLRQTSALITSQVDPNALPGGERSEASRKALGQQRFEQFRELSLEIAPKLAADPNKVAESIYDIVSAGYEDVGDVRGILEASTKAATAGRADPEIATKALVTTLQAYGDKLEGDTASERAQFVTDQMFQAVNTGIITFEQMAENLGKVTGTAAQGGVSLEEVMAAIQVTTLKGLQPDVAMTSINRLLTSMISPSVQEKNAAAEIFGTGKTKLSDDEERAIMDKYVNREDGRSEVREINDRLAEQASAALQDVWGPQALATNGLLGQITALKDVLQPTNEQLENLAKAEKAGNDVLSNAIAGEIAGDKIEALSDLFGDIRGLRSGLALVSGSGKTFEEALDLQDQSLGAVNRAFDEIAESTGFAEDQARSYLNVLRIRMGTELLPVLAEAARSISGFVDEKILGDEQFQNAKGGEKFKRLGEILWTSVVGWWENNKEGVLERVNAFLEWFGDVAIPKMVDLGVELGKELVPAILKGIASSPEALTLSGLFLGMKGAGGLGALGGAGGAAGKAGGLGALSKLSIVASSVALTAAAVTTYFDKRDDVRDQAEGVEGSAKEAALSGNFDGIKAGYESGNGGLAAQLGYKVFNSETPRSSLTNGVIEALNEMLPEMRRNLDMEGIRSLKDEIHSSGVFSELNKGEQRNVNTSLRSYMIGVGKEAGAWSSEAQAKLDEASEALNLNDGKGTEGLERLYELAQKGGNTGDEARQYLSSITALVGMEYDAVLAKEEERYSAILNQASAIGNLTESELTRIDNIHARLIERFGESFMAGKREVGDKDASGRTIISDDFIGPIGPNVVRERDALSTPKSAAGGKDAQGIGAYAWPELTKGKDGKFSLAQPGGGLNVNGPLIGEATVREEADIEKIADALAQALDRAAANSVPKVFG